MKTNNIVLDYAKDLITPFLNDLKSDFIGKQIELAELKEYLNLFINEYGNYKKLLRDTKKIEFDSEFMKKFFSHILPEKCENLSKGKIDYIHRIIDKFVNFLNMKRAMKINLQKDFIDKFYAVRSKKVNGSDIIPESVEFNYTLNIVERDIIDLSNVLFQNDTIDKEMIEKYFTKLYNYPEELVIDAIINLVEKVESDHLFMQLLYTIREFILVYDLHTAILNYIKNSHVEEKLLFRFVILYESLITFEFNLDYFHYNLPYKLKKDYNIPFDIIKFKEYLNSLKDEFFLMQERIYELNLFLKCKPIIKINPFNHETPFSNIEVKGLFNLTEKIDINLNFLIENLSNLMKEIYYRSFIQARYINRFFEKIIFPSEISLFERAQIHYSKYDFRKALFYINKFLKKHSNHIDGRLLKAKILIELKQLREAIKYLINIIKEAPDILDAYLELINALFLGGYFYSVYILGNYLLNFYPFNVKLYILTAFSAYQILKPFIKYLEIGMLLNEDNLLDFLKYEWIYERIKPKDEFQIKNAGDDEILEAEKRGREVILKVSKFIKYYQIFLPELLSEEYFKDIIRDPLYFFNDEKDFTKKNYFIFSFTKKLLSIFYYEFIFHDDTYIEFACNEEFIQFNFKMIKSLIEFLIEKKSRKKLSIENLKFDDDIFKEVFSKFKGNPNFILLTLILNEENIKNLILELYDEIISNCLRCKKSCLNKPEEQLIPFNSDHCSFNLGNYLNLINDLLYNFEEYLDILNLKENVIRKKVEDCEEFLFFLNLGEEHIKGTHQFEGVINKITIKEFLNNYVIENEIVRSKTAMKRMKRSLLSLLYFLHEKYSLFNEKKFKKLKNLIRKIDPFNN